MANRVQKLTVNVAVETTIKQALADLDNLSKKLSSLSLPTSMTGQLEKDIKNYGKLLSDALDFKPTTGNLGSYDKLIQKIGESYNSLSNSVTDFSKNAEQAFSSTAELDKYKKSLDSIQSTINKLVQSSKSDTLRSLGISEDVIGGTGTKTQRNEAYGRINTEYGKESTEAKELIKHISTLTGMRTKEATAINRIVVEEDKLNKENQTNIATTQQIVRGVQQQTVAQDGLTESLTDYVSESTRLQQIQAAQQFEGQIKRWTAFAVAIRFAKQQANELISTYKGLDESLTQIAVVSGQTRDQMWGMIGTYNEMAQRLGTTTQSVVESSKLYFQQGRTQSEVMKLVEQTTILATISELDFATATDYLTAAINGFKLSADDAINVTDVWANLAAKAAVDTSELAVAISKVASLAQSAGVEIEATSAFLTKMIETTREAPENLGTALKTIIARFQELKLDPLEELEDGIDANKVEKALKTAGVALRDLNGEFRDFDDVILDLSKEWDTLSRNQQRYIATIAAGARQQSRFIALVEDYQRNVDLINIANSSSGASTAQFATQLTGLQTSLNRVQSAWEGLYTSWSEGSNVLTAIFDGIAGTIALLGDMGVAYTTVAALVGFLTIKLVANVVATKAKSVAEAQSIITTVAEDVATGKQTTTITKNTTAKIANTKATIKNTLAQTASLGVIGLVVIAVAALAAGIAYLVTKREQDLKQIRENIQASREAAAQAYQHAQSLDMIQEEYERTYKAGGDLTGVNQTLIDQYPELASKIDLVTDSYYDVVAAMREAASEQRAIAGKNALVQFAEQYRESSMLVRDTYENYKTMAEAIRDGGLMMGATLNLGGADLLPGYAQDAENRLYYLEQVLEDQAGKYVEVDGQRVEITNIVEDKWEFDGKEYTLDGLKNELINRANGIVADLNAIELDNVQREQVTGYLQQLTNNYSDLAQTGLAAFARNIKAQDISYEKDKEGNLVFKKLLNDVEVQAQEYIQGLDTLYRSLGEEQQKLLMDYLSGNFSGVTVADSQAWEKLFAQYGIDEALSKLISNFYAQTEDIDAALERVGLVLSDKLTKVQKQAILNAYNNLEGTSFQEEAKRLWNNVFTPENLSEFFQTESIAEEVKAQLTNMLSSIELGDVDAILDALSVLREAGYGAGNVFYDTLIDSINLSKVAVRDLVTEIDDFTNAVSRMEKAVSGVSEEEAWSIFEDMKGVLPFLSNEIFENVFAWDALNNTWKISEELGTQYLEVLRNLADGNIDEAIAVLNNAKAQKQAAAAEASAMSVRLKSYAMGVAANGDFAISELAVAQQAAELISTLGGTPVAVQDYTSAVGDGAAALMAMAIELDQLNASLKDEEAEIDNNILALEAYKKRLNETDIALGGGGGGGSGGTTKATNDYTDALKANADALKEAAQAEEAAAKARIEAIKSVLEARKAELEAENKKLQEKIDKARDKLEIDLEAWQRYLDERLEDYQKHLDDMEKAANEARQKADDDNDRLKENNEVAQKYYKDQIKLIQDQIDAINDQAAAEDRLQKLREAQDAYERAKNSRTRVVLTRGGGWTFRRDQEEIASAQTNLRNAQNAVTVADLESQKKELQAQADAWAEQAKNIGKTTEELQRFNNAYANFANMGEQDRQLAYQVFAQEVIKNNALNQNATDLQQKFEDQSDENVPGTIAWNIKKTEELKERIADMINTIGMDYQEFIKESKIKEALSGLQETWDGKGPTEFSAGVDAAGKQVDKFTELLVKNGKEIEKNEKTIEKIDKTIENYDKLLKDLGKSTSELNKEQALFNEYYDKTLKQLEKGSKVWQDTAADIKAVAELYERANAAQKEYEAAKAASDAASGSVVSAYARGGINDYTGLAMLHGTRSQPEVVLNNSQAGRLFKFIDSLATLPIKETPNKKYESMAKTVIDQSVDQSTNFENCDFNVTTDANNVDALARDLKRFSPLRR